MKRKDRPHQKAAIKATIKGFKTNKLLRPRTMNPRRATSPPITNPLAPKIP